jgi:hypothetical protein
MNRFTYIIRNKLYIALTDKCISRSPIALRGPSYQPPPALDIFPLKVEPTPEDIFSAVDAAFEEGTVAVSSMESDEITFAGIGEPLLKLDVMAKGALLISESRHGAQFRLKTMGLVPGKDASQVRYLRFVTGMWCTLTSTRFVAKGRRTTCRGGN